MEIGSTSGATGALQNGGVVKTQSQQNQLNMNDFFTMMAAQLQYQDPMNPTDTNQFMAQMAQFGALEQLTNISSSLNFSLAASVVGKNVEYSIYDSTSGQSTTGSGIVTSVDVSGTKPTCTINDTQMSISDITNILADKSTDTDTTQTTDSEATNLADFANFIQLSNLADAANQMDNSDLNAASNNNSTNSTLLTTPML